MIRRLYSPAFVLLGAGALLIAGATGRAAGQAAQSPPSMLERVSAMRYHFTDVSRVHDAVIRGDLAGARAAATELAYMAVPPGTITVGVPFVIAISEAARRVLDAGELRAAAVQASEMLRRCGDCHQAIGVVPAPAPLTRPNVGGIVGHMLEHERAVSGLLHGLLIPSASEWRAGAERLRTAPLRASELPRDPGLTRDIAAAEERVHGLAERADAATTPVDRGAVYADLLTTCAQCHGLHRKVWGPGQ
jgi:mono/diheme cytochrome c family protein